ncbi:MAG: hypothetical protein IJR14_07675 [Synergistaceae bacterium]|nr:hypothetical protein [Synergistaceae bacterium]
MLNRLAQLTGTDIDEIDKSMGPEIVKGTGVPSTGDAYHQMESRDVAEAQTRTPAFKKFFGDWENDPANASKVVDANGEPLVVAHGTGRGDRVGSVFRPDRATSGPMAFFTDDIPMAESYAKNKADTSLAYDGIDYGQYKEQFRVTIRGFDSTIVTAWNELSAKARRDIAERAGHVTQDDDGNIIYEPSETDGTGAFQRHVKDKRGNVLSALVYHWLDSGTLFNREADFMKVLDLAGVTEALSREGMGEVRHMDPNYRDEKVYKVYLNIRSPFYATTQATEDFIRGLEAWYRGQPKGKYDKGSSSADAWDKNSVSIEEFAERVREDIEQGTGHAWTSIPDFVTDYLKSLGYDGIIDKGGKNGGREHGVYIPFYPEQIKSATDNRGTFDAGDPDIYHQNATAEQRLAAAEEAWGENVDGVLNGTIRQDAHVKVMETPTVFTLIGAQRLPIYVEASKISTVLAQHKGMTPEILKQVPRALADPVAIFTSKTHPNTRVVVMTEIQDTNGATVIVPVELGRKQHAYYVNKISSIYGKDSDVWFVDQVTDGRLRYIDRQKSSQWSNRTGLQLPAGTTTGNGPTIATEADLVKARARTGHYQRLGEDTARGYTRFEPEIKDEAGNILRDAQTIIGLLEDADASTLPHELGHVFLDAMKRLSMLDTLTAEGRQEWETIRDWLHVRDIDFSQELSEKDAKRWRTAHEKFSAGFEKYLATGKAPNSRLQQVFESFKRWLADIYGAVKDIMYRGADGKEHRFELSDEIRGVFDRMVGSVELDTDTDTDGRVAALDIERDEETLDIEDWEYPEMDGIEDETPEMDPEAQDAVRRWEYDWEMYHKDLTDWAFIKDVVDRIREFGGIKYEGLAERVGGREFAKDILARWSQIFRGKGLAPTDFDVVADWVFDRSGTAAAEYFSEMDMDSRDALIELLRSSSNKDKPRPPAPLIDINVDTTNALLERLGADGAKRYIKERTRYVRALQRILRERYDADKSDVQAKDDLLATYREQEEIRKSLEALERLEDAPDIDRERTENERLGLPEDVSDAAEPEQKAPRKPKKEDPDTRLTLLEAMRRGYQMAERASKEGWRAGKKEERAKLKAKMEEQRTKRRAAVEKTKARYEAKLKEQRERNVEKIRKINEKRKAKAEQTKKDFKAHLEKLRTEGKRRLARQKDRLMTAHRDMVKRLREASRARVETEKDRGRQRLASLKERMKIKATEKQDAARLLKDMEHRSSDERISYRKRQEIAALMEGKSPKRLKKELGLDGLRELREKVKALHEEGRKEYQEWLEKQEERVSKMAEEMRGALSKRTFDRPMAVSGRKDIGKQYKGARGRIARLGDKNYALTLSRDRFFDWIDGGRTKYDGPFTRLFVDKLKDAKASERKWTRERYANMEGTLKGQELTWAGLRDVATELDGKEYTWDELMGIYIGMKNEKSAAAILYGNFINEGRYDEAGARKAIETLIGRLDAKHRKVADAVVADHEAHFDRLNEALIEATNKGMEHEPFYAGMHRLEHQSYIRLLDDADEDALNKGMSRGSILQKVEDGFTKKRVVFSPEHQTAIELGLMSNWYSDVARHEHMAAFIGHARDMMSALLRKRGEDDKTIGRMVKERFGDTAWRSLVSFFDDSVNNDTVISHELLHGFFGKVAGARAYTYLGLNHHTAFKQMSSYLRFLIAVGPHKMLATTAKWLMSPKAFMDEVYRLSPGMRDRKVDPILHALKNDPIISPKYDKALEICMKPIEWIDHITCAIGWRAVYDANLAERGHEGAVREADRVVRLTQPISDARDKARLWRDNSAIRLMMQFTGDSMQTWGMMAYDLAQQLSSPEWSDKKKAFSTAVVIGLTATWYKALSDWLTGAGGDDDDDDEERDGIVSYAGKATVEQMINSFPLIGKELLAQYESFSGKYRGRGDGALTAPFGKIMQGARRIKKAWDNDDDAPGRAYWELAEGLSLLGMPPMPITGIRRLVRGLFGEEDE